MKKLVIFVLILTLFSLSAFAYPAKTTKPPKSSIKLNDRVIILKGAITYKLADQVCQQLVDFDSVSHQPIYMFIDSPGGIVDAGYKIIDVMNVIESPVIGVVTGWCMSMAVHVLVECDQKYAMEKAQFLIHDISLVLFYTPVRMAYKMVVDALIENKVALDHLVRLLTIPSDELEFLSATEWFFNSQSAWDIDLIHGVVEKIEFSKKFQMKDVFYSEERDADPIDQLLKELKLSRNDCVLVN